MRPPGTTISPSRESDRSDSATSGGAPFVARIAVFPIKALDAVSVSHSLVLPGGALSFDRKWALVDGDGRFVNGKTNPAVHRLRSAWDSDLRSVSLRSEEGNARTFRLDDDASELSAWLGGFFGFPVSLRCNPTVGYPDDTQSPGPTVISTATIAEVAGWFDLDVDEVRSRFRANLEIGGVPAFWEDRLFDAPGTTVRFRAGATIFEGVNPCQRCVVPQRDSATGREDRTFARRFAELRERTLPRWSRRDRFDHFYRLAVNTRLQRTQDARVLRVGDAVEILDTPKQHPVVTALPSALDEYWSGELAVVSVRRETPTVMTFRLRHPTRSSLPFSFRPGQFITASIAQGDSHLQRCYSISSSPSSTGYCEITVRREGRVSGLLHDRLQPGDRLHVAGPLGSFSLRDVPATNFAMIAGGVGITPLMSKIRYLADSGFAGEIDLIYSARTTSEIVFNDELVQLRKEFPRLSVHLTLTAADASWTGRHGRLTSEWIQEVVPDIGSRLIRLCGPTQMAAATQQMLRRLGVTSSRIAFESFGGSVDSAEHDVARVGDVRFVRSARTGRASGGRTLLDVALSTGVPIDYGCRAGVCGRCKTKILTGEVTVECDLALSQYERDCGIVLACQSRPVGDIEADC